MFMVHCRDCSSYLRPIPCDVQAEAA